MIFEQPVNIYSQDYVLKRFQSNETAVQVVRGKLSALISESELIELQNSKATMYSKLASAVLDINSLQLQFSDISSKYDTVNGQYSSLDAKVADYDEILIGFPIWWYVAPTIINTFLEAYDFTGKKITLFATSGGSGFGKTVQELQPSAPGAEIREGKLLNDGSKQAIENWVKSL